ncbi:hypothetical protein M440DRAFT_1441766 [Trichoderma longibrachiatum ATCC 18648]|uniref:Uncharacterized protein n=1 Tax=Trichoderma longibrachiatum ATCC 18648 TaxID=983965 RepID=A0A2T4BUB8_TRILO|nr:hypothetical protein M440DRAFT_1441766 [Trichoderma longibrachiatum ATCC 18648]
MSSHMSSESKAEAFDLGSDKVSLKERIELVWKDMRLNPTAPPPVDHEEDASGHSEENDDADDFATVSVRSDEAEPADIIVDCPLWRDLPECLMDDLLASARDGSNHIELLNKVLGNLLTCKFPSSIADECDMHLVVAAAADTLRRLPGCSTQLYDDTHLYSPYSHQTMSQEGYLIDPTTPEDHGRGSRWASYKVTTLFDTNTIRLALLVAYLDQTTHPLASYTMQGYVNLLSRLLETLSKSYQSFDFETWSHRHAYRVTLAFLWTAWQRSLLLYSHYVFGTRLRQQVNARFIDNLPFPDTPVDADIEFSTLGTSLQGDDAQESLGCDYVCRYSFELLKNSALSGTQDYRRLFARFNELFADKDARCRQTDSGTWAQCDGKSWKTCGRFFGLEVPDQSAHDISCAKPCKRLAWDEASYRGVDGPRSVCLSFTPPGGPLRYRTASDRTLAVSHVWSHGQGGTPDQGFNECLHDRHGLPHVELRSHPQCSSRLRLGSRHTAGPRSLHVLARTQHSSLLALRRLGHERGQDHDARQRQGDDDVSSREVARAQGYARVVFLRPLLVESVESGMTPELSAPFTAAQNRDEGERVAVAVCATREDHAQYVDVAYPEEYTDVYELEPECWEWKGVCWCASADVASRLRFETRQVRVV